jgi:hypothetical protein
MWQPLFKFLERLSILGVIRSAPRTLEGFGDPQAPDALGGTGWKAFTRAEPLFQIWGPLEGSPWEAYHAVPLFAALDRMDPSKIGPPPRETQAQSILPDTVVPGRPVPAWMTGETLCLVDLPGRAAVQAGVWLVSSGAGQPVCTFDHWPHARAILKPEHILAELLCWAPVMERARGRIRAGATPVWICDATRLGTRDGEPGEFDNRYFLDDSILPPPRLLVREGIRRVVYLSQGAGIPAGATPPVGDAIPLVDLEGWFTDLLVTGIPVFHASVTDPAFALDVFEAPVTRRTFQVARFRRSAAGGFGTEVPMPSESSSG